jgi:hypothetical protein
MVVNNSTADVFVVSGQLFRLERCEIQTSEPKTAGSIIRAAGSQGVVKDVRLVGNFYDGFTLAVHTAGIWRFDNIHVPGGVTWNQLFFLQATPPNTIGSLHINNLITSNQVTWKDAMFVLDTGVETLVVASSELGGIGTIIHCRNSLAGQAPRWIRFTNCFIEAGISSGTGIKLDAVRAFAYSGYIASCAVGVTVGASASDVDLSHIECVRIGQSAVTLARGCTDVSISNNIFVDTGQAVNNTYDTIHVDSHVSNFRILANSFKSEQAHLPRYCVYIADGRSTRYKVALNNFTNFSTDDIYNGGRGEQQVVWGNYTAHGHNL